MRKTNILVEVGDEVYSMVVEPFKKEKSLSRLVASLLKGYIEKDFIRAYADGTLEDMHRASVDVLDETVMKFKESLSIMGIHTDALKENTQQGMEEMSGYVNGEKEVEAPISSEESKMLRESVESVKEQNEQIIQMLNVLISGNDIKIVKTEEVREEKEVNEPKDTKVEEENFTISEESGYDDFEEDEVENVDAQVALAGLLEGNNFSF